MLVQVHRKQNTKNNKFYQNCLNASHHMNLFQTQKETQLINFYFLWHHICGSPPDSAVSFTVSSTAPFTVSSALQQNITKMSVRDHVIQVQDWCTISKVCKTQSCGSNKTEEQERKFPVHSIINPILSDSKLTPCQKMH